jgi:HK97 family phage prohead protease
MRIAGYATVYNRLRADLNELIRPGAFRAAVAEKCDVAVLIGHDGKRHLTSSRTGGLVLEEDELGVWAVIDLTRGGADAEHVRNVALRLGRVGLSVGFRARHVTRGVHRGRDVRYLDDCALEEVSILDHPAFDDAYAVPLQPGEAPLRARMQARLALRADIEERPPYGRASA